MYCLRCGGICDPRPSGFCMNCQRIIDDRNYLMYVLSLLKEAYQEVVTIRLREKIEKVIGIK